MTSDERAKQIHPDIWALAMDSAIANTMCAVYVQGDMDYTQWLEQSLIYAIRKKKLAEQTLTEVMGAAHHFVHMRR